MDLTFSKEDLDYQAEVRDFLTSEYPLAIKEKQDKRLPLEKEDIIIHDARNHTYRGPKRIY